MAALDAADFIVIGPSNPIVSIGPILAGPIQEVVAGRARAGVPVVAVSPIVGGVALKGPADRMLLSLGHESSARGVARIYQGIATAFVLDTVDEAQAPDIAALGLSTLVTDTIMADAAGRAQARRGRARVRGLDMTAGTRPRFAAIIPVGTLAGAKTRLGESLDAEEREALVEGLLARTVVAALAVERLDDVLVASPDREVLRRAADLGARTLRQRTRGLNAGLAEARADVVAGGAEAILVLPIDLPFVTAGGRRGPARAARPTPRPSSSSPTATAPARTPSRSDRPTSIDFAFGPGSRRRHRAAAEAAGATYVEVDGPLTVDLDTPDDLVYAESISPAVVGAD